MNETANKFSDDLIKFFVLVGGLSLVAGLLVFASYCSHIGRIDASSPALSSVIYRAGLVLCETVFTSVLGIAGLVFMALRERPQTIAGLSLGGFILKIIFSAFLYLPHSGKWYYILDPNGSHPGIFILIILSAVQLVMLFVLFRKFSVKTAQDNQI